MGQLKHKGRELLVLASFLFSFLNRALQFPKRFGLSLADPSAAHAKVLGSARSVFVHMVDSLATLGGAESSNLATTKFILSQIPRVFAFCDATVFRRGPTVGVAVHVPPLAPKELLEAQAVIHHLRNPAAAPKKASPELSKKKSSPAIAVGSSSSSQSLPQANQQQQQQQQPQGEDKGRSGTIFKNLFGGLKSPRSETKESKVGRLVFVAIVLIHSLCSLRLRRRAVRKVLASTFLLLPLAAARLCRRRASFRPSWRRRCCWPNAASR